eukprot:3164779-Prymnesium_polylepis.1
MDKSRTETVEQNKVTRGKGHVMEAAGCSFCDRWRKHGPGRPPGMGAATFLRTGPRRSSASSSSALRKLMPIFADKISLTLSNP